MGWTPPRVDAEVAGRVVRRMRLDGAGREAALRRLEAEAQELAREGQDPDLIARLHLERLGRDRDLGDGFGLAAQYGGRVFSCRLHDT